MMKIVVRRAGGGVAAATSLLVASGGAAGCVAPVDPGDAELTASAADALTAGSATLVAGGWPGGVDLGVTGSTTDEYVRAGESLSASFPAWLLWEALYPTEPLPDVTRLRQLKPTVQVTFLDRGAPLSTATLATGWVDGDVFSLSALSPSFVVPAQTEALAVAVALADDAAPAVTGSLSASVIRPVQVFGGDLPNKTALFDSDHGARRTRILEGSSPVRGASLDLGYTDWRADTLVDRSSINTQIGVRQAWGRFGPTTTPIFGTVVHEVSVGYFFDDGRGWQSEQALAPNAASRLLPAGRTGFERKLSVPAGATRLSMYFHVKAYLVADYTGYGGITEQWYAQGSRNLVREKWDNPSGSYTNYDFSLESQ
jgi:hypothetical protein